MQHEVGTVKVWPLGALHFELEVFGIKESAGVFLHLAIDADVALLHQASADAAGAETLAEEDVLKAHGFHGTTSRRYLTTLRFTSRP